MDIVTERLILRAWREEDAEDLYGYAKSLRIYMAMRNLHRSVRLLDGQCIQA